MSRATVDVESVQTFPMWGIGYFAYLIILVGAASVLMLTMNLLLGIAAMAFMGFVMWRSAAMVPSMVGLYEQGQEAMGRMATVVQQALTGIRVVKRFGRQVLESGKFDVEARDVWSYHAAASVKSVKRQAESSFVMNVAIITILAIGAQEILSGRLSPGDIAAFLLYMGIMATPIRMSGFAIVQASSAKASGERVFEILDAKSPVEESARAVAMPRAAGHVRFEGVSMSYDNHVPAVHDIDFEAQPGQLVAILGAAGSGKSSLVHLIPRFYDVTDGRVLIDGQDVRDVTLHSLRGNVGIVLQDSFAFASSISDNIGYGLDNPPLDDIVEAAKVAQLHEFVAGLPRWVRHMGRRARNHAVGGPAAAAGYRQDGAHRPPDPDTRRFAVERRCRDRVQDPAGPGRDRREQDDIGHSASPVHRP